MTANELLEQFQRLGERASYHLADDTSSGEWRIGYGLQRQAVAIYNEHPELHEQMLAIARERFIWRLPDDL